MSTERRQFAATSRILHWTMAAMVLTMLCIGVTMGRVVGQLPFSRVNSPPARYAILILVVIRFANRILNRPPPFPATMSRMERLVATASEYLMYALMFVLPLVGWGMLSAAHYPIVLFGSVQLPFILPHDAMFVRSVAKGTHDPRIFVFHYVPCALWGNTVSYP